MTGTALAYQAWPWRIGVVGCGWVAGLWLDHLGSRSDVEIVGYVDPDHTRAEERQRAYGAGPVCADLDALLTTAPDIVLNLTPPPVHAEVTLAALRAGCHVLSEKPLATSVCEAVVIVDAAERADRTVAVMQNRRHAPGIRRLARSLANWEHPFLLTADMFVPWTYGGFRTEIASPLLTDMAIHTFDQARFLVGRRPEWVHCHEIVLAGTWMQGAATAVATVGFEGGTVFDYRGSWSAPGAETSWNASWRAASAAGSILWDGESEPRPTCGADDRGTETALVGDATTDDHGRAIISMLGALANRRVPETAAADNLWSVAIVEAALESARGGRRVAISELCEP